MAMPKPRVLTSDDLNAAVYHYLEESGFLHTAFNFFHEAGLGRCDVKGKKIPQGALISIMQKGLQYVELEANSEVGNDEDFHVFHTVDLLTKDLDELKKEFIGSAKPESVGTAKVQSFNSVEPVKAQKNDSVETAKGQETNSVETTAVHRRRQLVQKVKMQGRNKRKMY